MQPGVIRMSQTARVLPGRSSLAAGPLMPSCLCQLDSADRPVPLALPRKGCGRGKRRGAPLHSDPQQGHHRVARLASRQLREVWPTSTPSQPAPRVRADNPFARCRQKHNPDRLANVPF